MLPPSEVMLPAVGDSPTRRRSSLITAAVVADVDALTISPAAAAAAASAAVIVSKVSLLMLFHIIIYIVWIYIFRELYEFTLQR